MARDSMRQVRKLRETMWEVGEERWAAMPGWEDFANISDHGRVFVTIRKVKANGLPKFKREIGGRYRKPHYLRGYLNVKIGPRGRQANVFIHKVVARVFVPNPNGHREVYHKDGNPENNHYTNLAWGTKADKHRAMTRGKFAVHKNSHGPARDVIHRVYEVWRSLKRGEQGKSIAARLGISNATVSKIKLRQVHTELIAMFDGTYPVPEARRADNTDRRCKIGQRDKEQHLIPPSSFRWEESPPPIPTAAELDSGPVPPTDNIPFANEEAG